MAAGTSAGPSPRVGGVDTVRGLAVACMVVDHLVVVFGGPPLIRLTIGRLAMPLFFITAGRCSGRLTWRHAGIAAIGIALPVVVPFIDSPNVLLWWAVGAVILAGIRTLGWSPAFVVLVTLGAAANGWSPTVGGLSYPPLTLWALMALGALLPWSWWSWGDRLPARDLLAWLGRHALPLYVGHVLVLSAAIAVL